MSFRKLLLAVAIVGSATGSPHMISAQPIGAGTTSGTFLNPTPPCPPAVCSGVGTNTVFWGDPEPGMPPNNLAFTGRGFSTALGQPFVLGLLQYQNSSTFSNIDTIDIRFQTSSSDPTFAQSAMLNLTVVQTENRGDPVADADFVFFTNFPQFGSFRVFEGEVSNVEILAAINSLDVLGFGRSFSLGFVGFGSVGNPSAAFTNPSVVPLPTSIIPEPSALLLLTSGLGMLALLKGRLSHPA
ncbi:MAG: PEP-CTERM sorting domain-containing protein [Nitrospiraceae bacterium]